MGEEKVTNNKKIGNIREEAINKRKVNKAIKKFIGKTRS